MLNLGTVRPGSTIYIPFDSFDGGTGASVTLTGLAVTDVEVYKDGGTTQRASDSGYTLLDTDGIDFDGITGIHGLSISLADNTTAGFWASGSRYFVVISSVTIDAQTVNFVAAAFDIGYPDAVLNTTIATLSSQTSFTLTVGPAEDDALNGCVVVIHDVASAVQLGTATILDYTGSTKTVTLAAGTTFTAAATDNIAVYAPIGIQSAAGVLWGSGAITAGSIATDAIGAAELADGAITAATFAAGAIDATAIATGAIDADSIAADAITAAKIAAGAIDAATFAADVDAEILSYLVDDATRIDASQLNTHSAITVAGIADGVWDEDATGHQTGGTFGQAIGDPGADTNTIFKATVTDATGATVGVDAAAILADTGTDGVVVASLAAGSITASVIADNAIDAGAIAPGAITSAKFAAGAIDATAIATGAIDADALASDAVDEIWAKALSDISAVPGITASALTALNWLFVLSRNKLTQTATTTTVMKDDGSTSLSTSTVSDDGSTFTRGEFA